MTRHLAVLAASQSVKVRARAFRARDGRTAVLYSLTGGSVSARQTLADAMVSQDTRVTHQDHRMYRSSLLFLIGA